MSSNNIYISSKNSNEKKSSTNIINEYKNKYNKKNVKTPKYSESFLSKISDKQAKIFAMNNLNKCQKNILQKVQKREIDKYYSNEEDINKNNIYLETEREIINNPKPIPLPLKINKNNIIDYNDIMQNSFYNKFIKNTKKNDKNKKYINNTFYKNKKLNSFNFEDNYNKSPFINISKINILEISKETSFKRNNKENDINDHINIDYNNKENVNIQKLNNNNIDLKLLFVLKRLDLEYLINCFNYHHIKFIDLFHLKKQDYLEMNIPIGPRNRIIKFINDYKMFAKKYDLNDLKIFFKNNNINNGLINDYSLKNITKIKISHSEKDLILRNTNNIENIKTYYKYHNYNSKNLFFKNNRNEEFKNSSNLLNKYNSLSDILNNIPNKKYKIKKRNKFLKEDNSQILLTFHNDNNNEKIFNCISPIIKKEETKYEKNEFYRNNSLKLNKTFFKQNSISSPINYQYKINEKKNKLYNNFYNINDEIKIFEKHLKEMREKSKETNSKVNNLLIRMKKNIYLNQKCKDKNDYNNCHKTLNDENYNILNNISKVNYNDKINNGYLNTHINSNMEKNRKKKYFNI